VVKAGSIENNEDAPGRRGYRRVGRGTAHKGQEIASGRAASLSLPRDHASSRDFFVGRGILLTHIYVVNIAARMPRRST
jgi:hypothetical protein